MKRKSYGVLWERLWRVIALDCDERSILDELDRTLNSKGFMSVTFVNPAAYKRVLDTPAYLRLLEQHDVVVCDGVGMIWAACLIWGRRGTRLSFDSTSLAQPIFRHAARKRLPVALMGGKRGVAERAAARIRDRFPDIVIAAVHHGHFETTDAACDWARASGGRVIVCGMGIPSQEHVAVALGGSGWNGVVFSCGGYLDQLDRGFDYYPPWIDRWNLRFLYRWYREPRRLARRYFYDYVWFAAAAVVALVRARLSKSSS